MYAYDENSFFFNYGNKMETIQESSKADVQTVELYNVESIPAGFHGETSSTIQVSVEAFDLQPIPKEPEDVTPSTHVNELEGDELDEEGYDTDLEKADEEIRKVRSYDGTGITLYKDACNRFGVVPSSYFIRHMQTENVIMKHHGLGPNGVKAMSVSLLSNTVINVLDIEDNWIGPMGALYVTDMMKENIYITELNLAHNNIGSAGCRAISELLMSNATLMKLNLAGNNFKDKDSHSLANSLIENSRTSWLDLSENEFGNRASHEFGRVLAENDTLEYLDLSWNEFRLRGVQNLCKGLSVNNRLRIFKFGFNGISDEGAVSMTKALRENKTLEHLDIRFTHLSPKGANTIAIGMADSASLKELVVANNPIQATGALSLIKKIITGQNTLQLLDLTGIQVCKEFADLEKEAILREKGTRIIHGGVLGTFQRQKPDSDNLQPKENSEKNEPPSATETVSKKSVVFDTNEPLSGMDTATTSEETILADLLVPKFSQDNISGLSDMSNG